MDKLILVHYLNLVYCTTARTKEHCIAYQKMLENKIECVNPKLISSNEYQSVLAKLEEFKAKQDEFLKNQGIGSEN